MSQATLREVISQERAAGKRDPDTLVLLRRSKLNPPTGFYCWSLLDVREATRQEAEAEPPIHARVGGRFRA